MENIYRRILEFSNDGVVHYTFEDGRILFANKGFVQILDMDKDPSELEGKFLKDVLKFSDKENTLQNLLKEKGETHGFEYHFKTLKDHDRWVIYDSFVTLDFATNKKIAEVILKDITKRKQEEITLGKLASIVEFSDDAVIGMTLEGVIESWNTGAEKIFGFKAKEIVGDPFTILVAGHNLAEAPDIIEKIKRGESIVHHETQWLKKGGEKIFVSLTISAIRDHLKQPTAVSVIARDITERKIAEQDKARAEVLTMIAEGLPDGVIITDLEGRIVQFNKMLRERYGYGPEIIDKTIVDLVADKDKSKIEKHIKNCIDQRKRYLNVEASIISRNVVLMPVLINTSILYDANGNPNSLIATITGITEQKIAEAEIMKAKKVAEDASRAKSEFLSNMSHEIRTPMNAIIGIADLLSETALTEEQKKYVQVYRYAGESLLSIIDNILDLSKIEAGQISLESIDFNLRETVEKVCDIMTLRAREKDVELSFQIMPDVTESLIGDSHKLREVLINLVGNSVKFTERGHIFLRVENDPERKVPGILLFSVSDTGIGIPEDKIDLIFERFTQADASTTRKFGGTGLGLTISRKIVELMDGRIWARSPSAIKIEWPSDTGVGSTFYFTVGFKPQQEDKLEAERRKRQISLKGMRALVIDDIAVNRMIVKDMLHHWGAAVEEADSGLSGIEKLKQSSDRGEPYDLILLDKHMPQMDGLEVARYIKAAKNMPSKTIVMLTSDSSAQDVKTAHDIGIEGYLVKPIKQNELKNAILSAIQKTKLAIAEEDSFRPEIKKEIKALNILLAEDSDDNVFLIQAYLKNTPHILDIAADGEKAVQKFKENKYDLILMDVQMPILDGNEATKRIRRIETEKGLEKTPIIALTAYVLPEEIQKSLDSGCDSHITKPVKKQKLLETIEEYGRKVING